MNLRTFAAEEATLISDANGPIDLRHAAQMAIMFTALQDLYLFKFNQEDHKGRT